MGVTRLLGDTHGLVYTHLLADTRQTLLVSIHSLTGIRGIYHLHIAGIYRFPDTDPA